MTIRMDMIMTRLMPIAGVRVIVTEAKGQKCLRCWKHHALVGANEQFPELCPRCAAVVAKLPVIE